MDAEQSARTMLGQIGDMNLAELSLFINSDKANNFMQKFNLAKKEFLEGLAIKASIEHIEKMALQSRHARDSAEKELKGARSNAKLITESAEKTKQRALAEVKAERGAVASERAEMQRAADKRMARIKRLEVEAAAALQGAGKLQEDARILKERIVEQRRSIAERVVAAEKFIGGIR